MSVFGAAAPGPALAMATSAEAPPLTMVAVAALLFSSFGSKLADVTVATLVNVVPGDVPDGIAKVSEKFTLPTARFAASQMTLPPAPTDGVAQLQPGGDDRLTNVMPAGTGSVRTILIAGSGPKFAR